MFRYFNNNQDVKRQDLVADNQNIQERIIQRKKTLILRTNKLLQEEAKYDYLKQSLVVQKFNIETLPRPNLVKRRMKTQTTGLPTLFGGTLEEYYESTGEKLPIVVESCISYINSYGMNHSGIFRIGGAQVLIQKPYKILKNS